MTIVLLEALRFGIIITGDNMNTNDVLEYYRGRDIFWLHSVIGVVFLFLILFVNVATSKAESKITLQLAWKHQFQFAGYYAALHKGYYQQAGLDVTIIEGGVGKFAREEVLNGNAQYGIAGSELLLHRKDGEPFVVLAPIFQHSPSILLARKDSGISNLQNLIGKKVMMLPGKKDADILASFLNEGISLDSFERKDQTYNLEDLIEGRTDAVSAYVTNEPWLLSKEGVEPMVISPQVYGVDFYSDCLFTTENEIAKHPEQVQRFLKASLLGWQYAMAHPEEMIDLLLTHYRVNKKRDHLRYEAESIEKLMLPLLVEIGHTNPGRWGHIVKTYEKLGLIDENFSLEGFLYDPQHKPDYKLLKKIAVTFSGVIIFFCIGGGVLLYFNRKLAAEVKDRKHAEIQYKETERQLTDLIGNLPGIAYRCKVKSGWDMEFISDGCFDITGYTPSEVSQNGELEYGEIIHPDDTQHVWDTVQKSREEKISFEIEYRIISKSGDIKWVWEKGAEVADVRTQDIYLEGFITDITERKMLSEKLQEAQKMQAMGTLAGGIAHDFNNILAAIMGFTELALDNAKHGSTQEGDLKEVYKASVRAKKIIAQILSYAKQDLNARELVSPSEIIDDILSLLVPTLPKDIRLSKRLDSSAKILINESQFHQVILNLCCNAIFAMQDSGGELKLSTDAVVICKDSQFVNIGLSLGNYLKIRVSDTGTGIQHEVIGSIFEPYFTTKDVGEGSGLGLAMTKGIVESAGGCILVKSTVNVETIFTLYLPIISKLH